MIDKMKIIIRIFKKMIKIILWLRKIPCYILTCLVMEMGCNPYPHSYLHYLYPFKFLRNFSKISGIFSVKISLEVNNILKFVKYLRYHFDTTLHFLT